MTVGILIGYTRSPDSIGAWMHETALRLFPDSPYAKEHSTEAPKKPAKD